MIMLTMISYYMTTLITYTQRTQEVRLAATIHYVFLFQALYS